MWTDKSKTMKKKRNKLSRKILQYLILSVLVAVFIFCFLYSTSLSIADTHILNHEIVIGESQDALLRLWIRNVCVMASMIVFVALFLFLLGQRLSYLICIIRGVDKLRESHLNFYIKPEGNDELTELAESINYLSASQKELNQREKTLKEERDAWVKAMSHDIRTPLTSLISYSELLQSKDDRSSDEVSTYISMVLTKSRQIQHLTEQLMDSNGGILEQVDNMNLLLHQLSSEWEELLNDHIPCSIQISCCESVSGSIDIHGLRRIFDNLASNVEKYADPKTDVVLNIDCKDGQIHIIQENGIRRGDLSSVDSHKIGLENLRRIAEQHHGSMSVSQDEARFRIEILLTISPFRPFSV